MELNERSFREWFILVLAAITAIEVGSIVVSWEIPQIAITLALLFLLAWIIWAGDNWWIPIFVALTVGGAFLFSFKLFPVDLALCMAIAGLLPMIVLGRAIHVPHRRRLSFWFYVLPIYLFIHLVINIHGAGSGGAGNMMRSFFNAAWPFIFGWLFYTFGKTSVVPRMVGAILCFTTLRIILVYIGFILGTIMYIPGINYVVGVNPSSGADVRGCAYFLIVNLLILYQATNNGFLKLIIAPLSIASVYLILIGGSRFETGTFLLMPLAFAVATRRWIFFISTLTTGVAIFILVNMFPFSLEKLPVTVERSLSVLIIKSEVTQIQTNLESSTGWHRALQAEGFKRWSSSPETIVFGSNLHPFRDNSLNRDPNQQDALSVETAADVANYESGFWTVVASLGVVGYGLYLLVFISLWRYTIPYLWHHPVRTVKEGIIFWGTYASLFWVIASDAAGYYPSLEMALLIVAATLAQDMSNEKNRTAYQEKSVLTSSSSVLSTV